MNMSPFKNVVKPKSAMYFLQKVDHLVCRLLSMSIFQSVYSKVSLSSNTVATFLMEYSYENN